MNINRKSWHFWLLSHFCAPSFRSDYPDSLCPYVRAVAWRSVLAGVVIAMIGIIFGGLGFSIMQCINDLLGPIFVSNTVDIAWYMWIPITLLGIIVCAVLIGGCLGLVFGVCAGLGFVYDTYKKRDFGKSIEESDNIIVKYIHAKHNRFCPKIDYKD